MPFWQEDFVWVVHRDSKYAKASGLKSSEVPSSDLMLLNEGHCLKEHILKVCDLTGASPSQAMQTSSLQTLIEMVACGLGVTLIPEIALSFVLQDHPNIRTIPLWAPSPHRELVFIFRPNYPRLSSLELLCQEFQQGFVQPSSLKK